VPAQNPTPPPAANRAARRAARKGKAVHAGRSDLPGGHAAPVRGAQGKRINPIRRTGS
jgi:hypothetical protein